MERITDEVLDRNAVPEFRERYGAIRDDLARLEDDAAATFRRITDDLEQEKPAIGRDDVPGPRPACPVDEPLFDSRRDYLAQIDAYRAWQGRGGEA